MEKLKILSFVFLLSSRRLICCLLIMCSGLAVAGDGLSASPERILLLPGASPHVSHTVTWRTPALMGESPAEIAEAIASPSLIKNTKTVTGTVQVLQLPDGLVSHHRITFKSLTPNTLYNYRVKGDGIWSEWFTFRTAAENFSPYSMIYFGDIQNHIQSLGARILRAAYAKAPDARLMLHAGDLTDRKGPEDELWRQWFAAGSWLFGSVAQVPVTGNHEYIETAGQLPKLRSAWSAHFALPDNGPQSLQKSVYRFDYQGVRYIILDSMIAIHSEEAAGLQAAWLESQLKNNPNHWTIVSYHHPLFSGAYARWNNMLTTHWQPLFERYGVDLVLQGDDHIYGRWQTADRAPVYTISVAGAKHNRVHPNAKKVLQRFGEDAQWYQVIDFEAERLRYRAWTVNGDLYDAFDLVRQPGKAAIVEIPDDILTAEQRCSKPATNDVITNPQEDKSRCWLVTELQ